VFAALAAIGAAPDGPLGVRYVRRLPTVPAARVVAGSIPRGTFAGRVVVVGRADAAAASVTTPLGPMSPAQVEAQALLAVLDEEALRWVPGWLRGAALVAWALVTAVALRRRGAAALVLVMLAALGIDAALYAGGAWALGAGAWIVAGLAAGAAEAGLRVMARATGRRAPADSASGLHASPQPSGPDQVSGA
jgi:CHASE2 domain-containing sensor protein